MVRSAPQSRRPTAPLPQLAHEVDLVDGAIKLVAGGAARRVSLVIRFGAEILPRAQAHGLESGVVVRALWRTGEGRCDLVVEPLG